MAMPKLPNKDKDTVLHLRMPKVVWKALKRQADVNGRTLRGEIVNRLETSLEIG
jgi:hypothetical protein